MTFYKHYLEYQKLNHNRIFDQVSDADVLRVLNKDRLNEYDYLMLLSPAAGNYLEEMAQKAHKLSLQHFGKSILLYTPMYLANYCVNRCVYCSFSLNNKIKRMKLTLTQIEGEARAIAKTGLRHILVLTGESRRDTPVSYIMEAVKLLRKYFHSVAIEIYPLTLEEYKQVIDIGVDGLTIYQEVYDEEVYKRVHPAGPKKNYLFRIDAPERACKVGIRGVNIGTLLGLNEWRTEAFMTGLHGNYLQNKYTEVEISISLPRIRPYKGSFKDVFTVGDLELVQILLATRIFLPYIGITISTRERPKLRDNLIPLGVTRMSAGVSTVVGGHSGFSVGESQFEISDTRSVEEIKKTILTRGYQPIFKDWMAI